MFPDRFGILTMGFGQRKYLDMAKAMAMSVRRFHHDVPMAIITAPSNAEEVRRWGLFDEIVLITEPELQGVLQKIKIYAYSPFERTLFIDSDCIVYKPLFDTVEVLGRSPFGVTHSVVRTRGEKYYVTNDLDRLLDYFQIPHIYDFNSGVMYFQKTPETRQIFDDVRALLPHAAPAGIGGYAAAAAPDEPLFAIAMIRRGLTPVEDPDRRLMATAIGQTRDLSSIDVRKGRSRYVKQGKPVEPAIIHFNASSQSYFVYRREIHRLFLGAYAATGLATLVAGAMHLRDDRNGLLPKLKAKLSRRLALRAS